MQSHAEEDFSPSYRQCVVGTFEQGLFSSLGVWVGAVWFVKVIFGTEIVLVASGHPCIHFSLLMLHSGSGGV